MSHRRAIATIALAVAYFAAAYGSTLRVMIPPVGSGIPAVQRATGQTKEVPRPTWTSRRHLPLVKLFSLDQLSTIACELTLHCDCRGLHPLSQPLLQYDQHAGPASPGRAPPVG